MGMNLTLDSYRAMIGKNCYGDVRFSESGGLEKINNHFAQHVFGSGKVTPSPLENRLIRQSFALALERYGIPEDTLKDICTRLGLNRDLSVLVSPVKTAEQNLSRHDIKTIISMADQAVMRQRSNRVADGPGSVMSVNFRSLGINYLKSQIANYNKDVAPAKKINLSSTELQILMDRHLASVDNFFATSETNGEAMRKLKTFIADKNLKEGESKFSVKAGARSRVDTELGMSQAMNKYARIMKARLALVGDGRIDALTNDDFKHLKLGSDAFRKFPVFTRAGGDEKDDDGHFIDTTKRQAEYAQKHAHDVEETSKPKIADKIFNQKAQNLTMEEQNAIFHVVNDSARNFIRNQPKIRFCLDGQSVVDIDFASELNKVPKKLVPEIGIDGNATGTMIEEEDTDKKKEICENLMVDALLQVKEKCGQMRFQQFYAATTVFRQAQYTVPGSVGMKGYSDAETMTVNIKSDGTLTMTCTVDNPTGEKPLFESQFDVNAQGVGQYVKLETNYE